MAVVSIKNKLRRGNLLVGNEAYDPAGFDSIATVTVGSGGASSVEFTSIPGTYTHLQIRYFATKSANGSIYFTVNNSTTGNKYDRHTMYGDGSSVGAEALVNSNSVDVQTGNNTSNFGITIIDILDYANTNKNKVIRALTGRDNNGSGIIYYQSGSWRDTSAITSIKFTPDSTNLVQYSHFALYGIASA